MSEERLLSHSSDSGENVPFPLIMYDPADDIPSEEVKEASGQASKAGTKEEIPAASAEGNTNAGFDHPESSVGAASGICRFRDPPLDPPQSSSNPQDPPSDGDRPLVPPQGSGGLLREIEVLGRRFTQSWFYIGITFALLIVPILYFYIGLAYSQRCIYLKYFPLWFLLKGASGSMALVARVIRLTAEKLLDPRVCSRCTFIYNVTFILFWAIHACELFSLLYSGVLIQPFPDPSLCHPVFYSFAIHSLWVVPLIWFILFVPQIPTYCTQRLRAILS